MTMLRILSKRLLRGSVSGLFFVLLICVGCATSVQKPSDTKDQVPREDKYGKLKGPVYFNEFYRFQVTAPRGWQAIRPKTDIVVRMTPFEKEFKIEISVQENVMDTNLDNHLKKLLKEGSYELESQESITFFDSSAVMIAVKSMTGVMSIKKKILLVHRYNNLYHVSYTAPLENYSLFEKSFSETMDSFRFTDTLIEGVGEFDYFSYRVTPNDTLHGLATRFLNDPNESVTIAHFNQMSTLIANREIDIPRYRTYTVKEGDTREKISQKFYNSPQYFYLIPPYNAQINEADLLVPGTVIKAPLYFLYTVKQGDTLPRLAMTYLRSEDRADLIYLYNGQEPIRVGMIIKIPILWAERDFIVYTVQRDDSLSSIAETYTGNISNFPILAEFNNIQPPFEIVIGQQIKIPKDMVVERPKPKTSSKKSDQGKRAGEQPVEEPEPEEETIEGPIYEPE